MIHEKICPEVHADNRGSLYEIYTHAQSHKISPKHMYISKSSVGVVRGFHQQLNIPQKKLVFCLSGSIIDYALNIDPLSKEFGIVNCHVLNGDIGEGVLIDRKSAHAFECLSEECTLLYICDDYYDPTGQLSINPLDPVFKSLWKTKEPQLSSKDSEGVSLNDAKEILLKQLRI